MTLLLELGHATAYGCIGGSYYSDREVERDMKKAKHYWELAVIWWSGQEWHNLGVL